MDCRKTASTYPSTSQTRTAERTDESNGQADIGAVNIKSAVQNLVDSSLRAIVVVDDCSTKLHHDLVAIVKRSSSKLSLVTIDTELPVGALSADSLKVELASSEVVEGLLKQVAPDLPSDDQRRLVKFASGYPQMAILIGSAWLNDRSIATIGDDELVERVLVGRSL